MNDCVLCLFIKWKLQHCKSTSGFGFSDVAPLSLKRSKSICGRNCDETSQFAAKVLILEFTFRFRFCYPNVTTLRSDLCCRKSVCLSSVVCRLYVVCNVGVAYPTQAVEPFAIFLQHCIPWPPSDLRTKFYGDRPRGTPPSNALNTRGVGKYSDFGPVEGYIS